MRAHGRGRASAARHTLRMQAGRSVKSSAWCRWPGCPPGQAAGARRCGMKAAAAALRAAGRCLKARATATPGLIDNAAMRRRAARCVLARHRADHPPANQQPAAPASAPEAGAAAGRQCSGLPETRGRRAASPKCQSMRARPHRGPERAAGRQQGRTAGGLAKLEWYGTRRLGALTDEPALWTMKHRRRGAPQRVARAQQRAPRWRAVLASALSQRPLRADCAKQRAQPWVALRLRERMNRRAACALAQSGRGHSRRERWQRAAGSCKPGRMADSGSLSGGASDLEDSFEAAAAFVQTRVTQGAGDDVRLELYALYKQATAGDCPASPPARSLLDWRARAKRCASRGA